MTLNYRPLSRVWGDAARYLVSPPQGVRLPWWPRFSDMVGGLRPHELTLLCAPTGAGKTQLLANLSAQLLGMDIPHFVAPVETGDTDFALRLLSVIQKRDYNIGEAVPEHEVKAISKSLEPLLEREVYIASYDNRVEIEEMTAMLKWMHSEHGCQVALLDNLNFFLKVVSAQQERAEMDAAVHEFVMLAKAIPMHILLIVHPKKTEGGRVESEFDIKGSSTAVQEASNVLLFNRPKQEDVDADAHYPTDRELVFRKIRKRGVNVGKPIWFQFTEGRYQELKR
jgi:replicative DNA helicase